MESRFCTERELMLFICAQTEMTESGLGNKCIAFSTCTCNVNIVVLWSCIAFVFIKSEIIILCGKSVCKFALQIVHKLTYIKQPKLLLLLLWLFNFS